MKTKRRKNAIKVEELLKRKDITPENRARLEKFAGEVDAVEAKAEKAKTPAARQAAAKEKRSILARIASGVKGMFGSKKKKSKKAPLKQRAKSATHKATGWLLNGKKKKTAKKKNKTIITKPRKVTVINGKKKSKKKNGTRARQANALRTQIKRLLKIKSTLKVAAAKAAIDREISRLKNELMALKVAAKKRTTRRRNLDHPDRNHQVEVRHGKSKNTTRRAGGTALRRRNSAASAVELFEKFQGRDPERNLYVEGDSAMPSNAATLGLLKELQLENGRVLKFGRFDGVYLAAAKRAGSDHLYVVGNYEVPVPKGLTIPVHISRVVSVSYETRKNHIGDGKTYEFEHRFADEGGERPMLTVDPSGKIHFSGGSYFIRREGIRD